MRAGLGIAILVAVGTFGPRSLTAQAPREPSTSQLVQAAARYVADYEQALASVIAEETSTQVLTGDLPPDTPRMRTTKGEVVFTFATQERHWMAIRDVYEVDGEAVAERGAVGRTLQSVSAKQAADYFRQQNSRWNIGSIVRNFNEPTITLLVLDARHRGRFSFKRRSIGTSGERAIAILDFEERERPTLIMDDTSGRPVFSRGEFMMDIETGRILNTTLRLEADALKVELTTVYREDPKLKLWVPSVFRERYERIPGRRGRRAPASEDTSAQRVDCQAAYSNYRQFDVLTRVK